MYGLWFMIYEFIFKEKMYLFCIILYFLFLIKTGKGLNCADFVVLSTAQRYVYRSSQSDFSNGSSASSHIDIILTTHYRVHTIEYTL